MYPNLYYLFKDLFGVEWPFLAVLQTFGFFVAVAFLTCAWVLSLELKRKDKEGVIPAEIIEREVGKKPTVQDWIFNALLGFVFGYKLLGLITAGAEVASDPQGYLFSFKGSIVGGIALAGVMGWLRYSELKQQELPKPEMKKFRMPAYQRVGDITGLAAIGGIIGAKVFNALETWSDFIADPIGNLFSMSGLTFYGGLIGGAVTVIWYCRKHRIPLLHLLDTMATTMMLAYGLGRIGCQMAGDGDWGIVNLKPNPFSWLPDWMWSFKYPHNVNSEGIAIPGCVGRYCAELPQPVWPTPFYETIICLILFAVLWMLRKRVGKPGVLFGIYLLFNGIERFLIEKIRVNTKYDLGFIHPTQAEIISTIMMIVALLWIWYFNSRKAEPKVAA